MSIESKKPRRTGAERIAAKRARGEREEARRAAYDRYLTEFAERLAARNAARTSSAILNMFGSNDEQAFRAESAIEMNRALRVDEEPVDDQA